MPMNKRHAIAVRHQPSRQYDPESVFDIHGLTHFLCIEFRCQHTATYVAEQCVLRGMPTDMGAISVV